MKKWMWWGCAALAVVNLSACDPQKDAVDAEKTVVSDFESGTDDWSGDFAEYSTQQDDIMEFKLERASLPAALDASKKAMKIEGHNRSDDMFMYLKRKVTGLDPSRTYKVTFEIDLGTDYPANSVGIGGSPGSSVYLKAGASPNEPVKKLVDDFYTVTIDKGQQAVGGKEMIVIGDVSNGVEDFVYKLVKRTNSETPVSVKPNANGEIWLCVGTDSGFEGKSTLYYDKIKAVIK
ncbi:hypothetical protein [Telluribacter sp.]|jgi:hypothetical protein|uniref:hypothetical protein n=1 Tax=Telluribacter sp. TaxID=1978767 RepID=UPI002E11F1EE|nr:hypothetical protein [Telluribacter sp.]